MKNCKFKEAVFLCSAFQKDQLPVIKTSTNRPAPEIAIVGRSNVGKSSLINHLLNNRTLAKTSSKPGKTQSINFFLIDKEIALVDLPGYGYAKVSKEIREEWGTFINSYLETRQNLELILFLIDIRRTPTLEDCAFIQWAAFHKKPLILVFTKTDKLKAHEIKKAIENSLDCLTKNFPNFDINKGKDRQDLFLPYSIKSNTARMKLIEKINRTLSK